MLYRFVPFAIIALLISVAHPSYAGDDLDRLRDAVKRGEVMPLSALQEEVRRIFSGEIIKVELDEHHGHFIYEFKVLKENGRLVEIEMDAKDGRILDVDEDDHHDHHDHHDHD